MPARTDTDLNILELSEILQMLATGRRTGTLKVTGRHGEEAYIYLKNGQIRLASSSLSGMDLLEEGLLKTRRITREELDLAFESAAESGGDMARVLLSEGRFEESELREVLARQILERVAELLSWKDALCEFFRDRIAEPALRPSLAEFSRGVVVDGIMLEAARRADEWERIQQTFDPARDVFELVREMPEHLSQPAERELAELIDGVRDIAEVTELSSMFGFQACTALLGMIKSGYVRARNADQLVQLGRELAYQGDWEMALRRYQRARAMDRGRTDLPELLAEAHGALGQTEQARKNLLEFARERMEHGHHDDAARASRRLVEMDPEEPEHRARLFRALLEGGERRELVSVGKELVESYEKRGTLDRAGEVLVKLRGLFPEDAELTEMDVRIRLASAERTEALVEYEKLADSYLSRGKLEDAVRTYRKIIEDIDEECIEARLQLAESLIQLERIDEAVAEYIALSEVLSRTGVFGDSVNLPFVLKVNQRIAELAPSNTSSREWLAETYAARGEREKALAEFDQLIRIYEKAANREKVIATLSRLADLYPELLKYRERLAECYLKEGGGGEKAKAELKGLCRASWEQGDFETGVRVAEHLLELDPFHMEAHVLLGEALMGKGQTEAAVEKLLSVALMYMGAGFLREAEEVFREVLKTAGDSVDAHRFLAAVLEERGSREDAVYHYKQAGLLSLEGSDFGTARTNLEFARALAPDDGEITEALHRLPEQVRY